MTAQELYTKGAYVWLPSEDTVWQVGCLVNGLNAGDKELDVRLEDGTTVAVKLSTDKDLPPLRNPEIFRGHSDLTQLSYLHEPAVLHNLKVRFAGHQTIYTYCGIVLVAINPYREMTIYDQNTMETYRGCAMGELDPHIFAIAEEAFTKMEREDKDQAIIVSGESGAGKTVSAKYAMRYFAAANGSTTENNVEKRVLATNPIMEAIGNAKTTRNDNSSRFGKFIEIDFDKQFNITGAKMRTYLLEKSRVVFQSVEERNYHIFYQLCAAAQERPRDYIELRLGAPEDFRYTSQGGKPVIDGVDDYEAFKDTCEALDLLSFPQDDQYMMFHILAAILHLGDVKFFAADQDSSGIIANDPHLPVFAKLLGINASQMSMWLTKKKLVTGKEQMMKPLKLADAETGRDAFAKHIYSRLFNWIVGHVNKKLIPDRQPHHFIGVLDIYGFETFEKNSFEQFCINYANEKLQQQFVIHVFKLEQEEYIKEEIEWTMIDFFDNQPCIDLIEGRLGILDLLDEECRMPKGSDGTWNQKMINNAKEKEKSGDKSWKYFEKPRFSNESFIINHFADKVEYDSDGFLDKNRDTMNEEFVNLLRASEFPLVAQLFQDTTESLTAGKTPEKPSKAGTPAKTGAGFTHSNTPTPRSAGTAHKSHTQSVGSQFQDSLKALMDTLNKTTPHYVRCIKPNDVKAAFEFDPKRAIQQLRACGVLETIRISAAGYPSRWTYKDFFVRYRVMCRSKDIDRTHIRKTVEVIVRQLIEGQDKYKFGKTMIFFRAGQVAYMEKLRADRRMACGLIIQKCLRGWCARKRYLKLRKTALALQTAARGYLARKHYRHLKQTAAATRIQTAFRGYEARKRYQCLLRTAVGLQALARGRAARAIYTARVRHEKAIIIQKHVRGFLARRRCQRRLKKVVLVQSCVRRYLAKRQLKALKIQARDVNHVKQLNKGLENKIFTLQQRVDELNRELVTRRKGDDELHDLRAKAAAIRQMESDLHQRTNEIALLHQTITDLRHDITAQKTHAATLAEDIVHLRGVVITKDTSLGEATARHNEELQTLRRENHALHEVSKGQSVLLTREWEERIEGLQRELNEEREGRQRVLDDLDRVRQRHANLEDQMKLEGRQIRNLQRTPSDVSNGSDNSLATNSTAFVPEIGDDGYSTQRSKATSRRGHNGWAGGAHEEFPDDTVADLQTAGNGLGEMDAVAAFEVNVDDMQGLRDEIVILRHQLEMRPPIDELVSEKIKRFLEVNLALRSCLTQCQKALRGEMSENEVFELRSNLEVLSEQTASDLSTSVPNAVVEDVGILDPTSLNQLFFSLREALTIQATETRQLMDGRNKLSERYTLLLKENDCLKVMIAKLSKSSSFKSTVTKLAADAAQTLVQNDALVKENKSLKRKLDNALGPRGMTGSDTPVHNILTDHDLEDDVPMIQHLKSSHLGMLEYPQSATERLIQTLVCVPPQLASSLNLPGLPAYLLFMAVRYTDQINNEKAVKELLAGTKNAVHNLLKNKKSGIEHFALWLLNGLRLVDLMKQYSGEEKLQRENTVKQNQHALRQFDLSAFRQQFDDLCIGIYRSLVTFMQRELKDDAAKAVIEHESVLGLKEPGTLPRRWKTKSPAECFASTMKKLDTFYRMVTLDHALDPSIVRQIFKQLLYCLSANSVNFLMQSQKTCTFVVGIQIRANISVIHEFVRLHAAIFGDEIMQAMAAITECAHILQARKEKDDDIGSIISMSKFLSNAQILKLLQNYTPSESYDTVTPDFIQKMQARLTDRPEPSAPGLLPQTPGSGSSSLLLSTDYVYPVVFPYSPSTVELDTIQIPASLHLDFVKKI